MSLSLSAKFSRGVRVYLGRADKHFLRRYAALRQRIAAGDVVLKHVTDPEMPADFLTKWIPSAKLEASLRYATNSRHAVLPDATEQSAPPVQIGGSVSVTP